MKQARFSAGDPETRVRSGTKVLAPVYSLCSSLQLVKRAGVEFGDSDNHPARRSQMEIESIDLLERSAHAHATFHDLGRAETEIPNFRCENLFQSGSRNYENAERIRCSRSAQRIILFKPEKLFFETSASRDVVSAEYTPLLGPSRGNSSCL